MPLTADQTKRLERLRLRYPPGAAHQRYSRFVGVMKILLPSLAAVLLAIVVAWPRLVMEDDRFRIGFAKIGPESVQTLSMVNARYYGIDKNNRPFNVTSDLARQRDQQPDIIDLTNPKADFTTKDGAAVFTDAERGVYHQKEQLLDLFGKVSLYHEKGYEIHTEEAYVNLKDNTAHGEVPVNGQGPQGLLEGQGFTIKDKGSEVTVIGHSALTLKSATGFSAAKGKGAKK